ncbi:MAG TPA: roadblock/LC7 domain-containing protein [Nevskiaceae bacterium]|nr:roadblock/LC7 domain-containing protein [Nevskiaceae bacterium]
MALHHFPAEWLGTTRRHLQALADRVPGVQGIVLASSDGFEIDCLATRSGAASRLAAIASSLLALGQAALRELGFAGSGTVLIQNEAGHILLLEGRYRDRTLVLCTVAGPSAVTGTLLWAARECLASLTAESRISAAA